MSGPIRTSIDRDACVGCEACTEICPYDALGMVDGKAAVVGEESMFCGQCAAVCPVGAVRVPGVEAVDLVTVEQGSPAADLARIMASRRSCRSYTDEPVDVGVLRDLVRAGTLAPSGTNSQRWTFTIVAGREQVIELARAVGGFYERLNRLAANRVARAYSKLFMKDALGRYHREYSERVAEALDQWQRQGRDRLFHGATAGIVVGMKPGASCPGEDALMASQNIVLLAEALGLGTCLVGFAVEAMRRDPSICQKLGIPREERAHAVIAVGRPRVRYARPAGRLEAPVRVR